MWSYPHLQDLACVCGSRIRQFYFVAFIFQLWISWVSISFLGKILFRPFPSAYFSRSTVPTIQEVCKGTLSVQFTCLRGSQGFQSQAVFFLPSTRKTCIYYLKKKKLQFFLGFLQVSHHSRAFFPGLSPHLLSSWLFILVMNFLSIISFLLHCLLWQLGASLHGSPTFGSPTLLTLLSLGRRRKNILSYPSKTHNLPHG